MPGVTSLMGFWLRSAAQGCAGDSELQERLFRAAETATCLRWRESLPRLHGLTSEAWTDLAELAESLKVLAQTERLRDHVIAGADGEDLLDQISTAIFNNENWNNDNWNRFDGLARAWLAAWHIEQHARREALRVRDEKEARAEIEACLKLTGETKPFESQDLTASRN